MLRDVPKTPFGGPQWKPAEVDLLRATLMAGKSYEDVMLLLAENGFPLRKKKSIQLRAYKEGIPYSYNHQAQAVATRRLRKPKTTLPENAGNRTPAVREAVSTLPPMGGVGSSDGCQFPYRTQGTMPGQRYRFCGRQCVVGKPYCVGHVGEVYAPLQRSSEYNSGRVL